MCRAAIHHVHQEHKLHGFYLVMVSNHWSPISLYLNGYTNGYYIYVCVCSQRAAPFLRIRRTLFPLYNMNILCTHILYILRFHRHWSLQLIRERLYGGYAGTINRKIQYKNRWRHTSRRIKFVYYSKKNDDVFGFENNQLHIYTHPHTVHRGRTVKC